MYAACAAENFLRASRNPLVRRILTIAARLGDVGPSLVAELVLASALDMSFKDLVHPICTWPALRRGNWDSKASATNRDQRPGLCRARLTLEGLDHFGRTPATFQLTGLLLDPEVLDVVRDLPFGVTSLPALSMSRTTAAVLAAHQPDTLAPAIRFATTPRIFVLLRLPRQACFLCAYASHSEKIEIVPSRGCLERRRCSRFPARLASRSCSHDAGAIRLLGSLIVESHLALDLGFGGRCRAGVGEGALGLARVYRRQRARSRQLRLRHSRSPVS